MVRFLRYFVYCLVIFLLLGANSVCASPKVFVDKPVFHAGDIPQGKEINHEFTLKNIGDEVLAIDIKRCWGVKVTAPGGPKTTIGPGESKKITVSIPTTYRRGQLKRDIYVRTNDPDAKTLTLSIQANIIEDLYIRPLSINFGIVKQGSSSEKEILITNKGKNPVSIMDIVPRLGNMLTISLPHKFTLAPGQTRKLTLTLLPGSKVIIVHGSVIIKTDIEYLPRKVIRVRARIVAND